MFDSLYSDILYISLLLLFFYLGLDPTTLSLCRKILFPYMAGCEPEGTNALELHTKFPALTRPDVVRFLVARKGEEYSTPAPSLLSRFI
ncbi:hypothetical protein EON65_54920, partial [archaeon]